MSFTYAQLKSTIEAYCEVSESTFTSNLPVFIQEAEERILKAVELPVFRKNVTGTAEGGNPYLSMPTDFLAPLSLAVISSNEYTYLLFKHVSFMRDYSPNPNTTGLPLYFSQFDDTTFLLAPTPNQPSVGVNYTFELHYKYRPDSLTAGSDSGTTWLSVNAPNAILYGSLIEAVNFLKAPEELANYEQRFQESLLGLNKLGEGYGLRDEYRYDISRTG
jgi:hypothetical protein